MSFCNQPFYRIEIFEEGDVYTCCPHFISFYSIGNIYKNSFEEIWNGEKARDLRKKILSNDYSLCQDICHLKNNNDTNTRNYSETINYFPEIISISSDNSCNVRCKFCRDDFLHTSYKNETTEEEIEKIWLPIFKDAKIVLFGCSGEPFASYKEKLIIKKTAEKYPNLKFNFHTNGILGNKELLKELNVIDKIDTIKVSFHAATKQTYNKIVKGGDFDKVLSNLQFYSALKKLKKIEYLRFVFVAYEENYKEMPDFVKLAEDHGAIAEFWSLRKSEHSDMGRKFEKYSITNPKHRKHKDFLKVLNNPIFDKKNVMLYPEIAILRKPNI